MNQVKYFLGVVALSALFVACGGEKKEEQKTENQTPATTEATAPAANGAFAVDTATSVVDWKATKKVGGHNGTVKFDASSLTVENGNITGGKFTINLNTIKDLDEKDAANNAKLVGHLKAADFFDVAKFPTATFEVTKAEAVKDNPEATHNISGKLTIRGVSKDITTPAKVAINGKELSATTSFKFNRQDYGIIFHSANDKKFDMKTMADYFINDDVELSLNVKAKAN